MGHSRLSHCPLHLLSVNLLSQNVALQLGGFKCPDVGRDDFLGGGRFPVRSLFAEDFRVFHVDMGNGGIRI